MTARAAATPLTHGPAARAVLPAWAESLAIRIGAIVFALAAGAVFLYLTGHDAASAYREMAVGSLGSRYAIEQTLVKAIPLMLTGLAVTLTFTMGLWNIGAEGQLVVGALAASWLALGSADLSRAVMLPGVIVLGMAGGALWAFIPAVLKVAAGMNEIISTLMLNYVALLWVDYLVFGAWADPTAFSFPYSRPFPESAYLPALAGDVHLGLLFAIVAACALAVLLRRTQWGFEIRTIGAGAAAAKYAGMPVRRRIVMAMAASGALAGLAGVGEVSGVIHRLQQGLSPGYGFTGIIIAWVAQLNPWAVLVLAVLFAALLNGGFVIQTAGVPAAIAYMIQALVLFFVLASEYWLRRARRRRAASEMAAVATAGVRTAEETRPHDTRAAG